MNHDILSFAVLYGGAVVTGMFFAVLPVLLGKLK